MSGARRAAAGGLNRRTQGTEILGIEGMQRCFDRGSDTDNSFFHGRAKKRNPKFTSG